MTKRFDEARGGRRTALRRPPTNFMKVSLHIRHPAGRGNCAGCCALDGDGQLQARPHGPVGESRYGGLSGADRGCEVRLPQSVAREIGLKLAHAAVYAPQEYARQA